ncbi:MAG: beta-propeller fold lactonase family protein [Nitrosomonadales bacterium]|nr:beta-propeller fold lactonase family protein [Nitrosomonadales bacterium]
MSTLILAACGGGGGGGGAAGTTTVRSAYVANYGLNNVAQYTIDATTGALTPMAVPTVAAGTWPTSITVDVSGKHVYVANSLDSVVSQYTIGAGGALQPMTPATVASGAAAGAGPVSIALDPAGKYAYAANASSGDVTQFSIDPVTGALTNVATVAAGKNPASIALATDVAGNKYAYVVNSGFACAAPCTAIPGSVSQYNVNASTGALTVMTTASVATTGTDPVFIAVDATGTYAYVVNYTGANITQYTIAAGALTSPTTVAVGTGATNPTSIALAGQYAYVSSGLGVTQYKIVTGGLTSPVSTGTGGFTQRSVAVNAAGTNVYVANQASDSIAQFGVNTTTGAMTAITPATVSLAAGSQPYFITTAVSIQ